MKGPRRTAQLVLYRIVVPLATLISLLASWPRAATQYPATSAAIDLLVRVWFAVFFSAYYYLISDLRRYAGWLGMNRYTDGDGDLGTTVWNALSVLLALVIPAICAYGSIAEYVPRLKPWALHLATAYGLLSAIPVALHLHSQKSAGGNPAAVRKMQ